MAHNEQIGVDVHAVRLTSRVHFKRPEFAPKLDGQYPRENSQPLTYRGDIARRAFPFPGRVQAHEWLPGAAAISRGIAGRIV